MEGKKNNSLKRMIIVAGAFFSANAGAGTASGQDILQYFVNYGVKECALTLILGAVIFYIMNDIIIKFGHDEASYLQDVNTYEFYCGKYVGWLLRILMPVFLMATAITMCSGAGAALRQMWGVPQFVGTAIVVVVMTVCYLLGSRTLVNILGGIGPIIIIFAFAVGIYSLIHGTEFGTADSYIQSHEVLTVSGHWWLSAMLFAVFGPLVMAMFLQEMGTNESDRKALSRGILVGSIFYMGVVAIIAFAEIANISLVETADIPTLALATQISPILGYFYSIIVLLAIYTTVTPLHWSFCHSFGKSNSKKKDRIIAIVGAAIILAGSQLPYAILINTLYPFVCYFGIIFFFLVVVKWILWKKKASKGGQEDAAV